MQIEAQHQQGMQRPQHIEQRNEQQQIGADHADAHAVTRGEAHMRQHRQWEDQARCRRDPVAPLGEVRLAQVTADVARAP